MTSIDNLLAAVGSAVVLVVDDQPANTLLVRRLLERAGLPSVTEINDSTVVQAMLPDVSPDLVLLDLKMPVMDGYDVLEQIQRFAAGTFLPVIVLTADDSHESLEKALAMGAHDFLKKPFDHVELTLRVRNLLLTRAATQELRRSRRTLRQRLDVFEPELVSVETDRDGIRQLIGDTLADDNFDIVLQPVVDMRDGSVVGAEALSRFPSGGVLATPVAWFSAAQRVGLSSQLEGRAFVKALERLPAMQPEHYLAVNVSPALVLAGLADVVAPEDVWRRIVLELTEHVPVDDYTALNHGLDALRRLGARLAVDDTGAGYASLRHIVDLHPDVIKMDIGIVRGVDRDPTRTAVAELLLRFAERIGAHVVAEGVETEAERATLLDLGAIWGQGYLFGRPA